MDKKKKNKFRYWFDNQMAMGTPALIKLFTIVTVVVVLIVGLLVCIAGYNLWQGIFISITHLMDPGTVGGDDPDDFIYVAGMLLVTFFGIFLTSTLTGIICNAIDEKVADLRRGKSPVVEKGHVIVLGTADGIYTIISELIEANSNHKREALVIMDDKEPKDEMDDKINARFPDKKTTQIICRSGSITSATDLEVCGFDTCMSVIINADSDAETLKSILVVVNLLKKYENKDAYITAVIRNEQNKEAAELAGEGYVEVLSYEDVMCRIVAHTGRYTGLSLVYTDLFDMDGSEFYIEEHPDSEGKTIAELNRYFPESIAAGFVTAEGEILLNPEPDRKAAKGDRIILFAEDDGVSKMDPAPAPIREDIIVKEYVKEPPAKTNMLILGYSAKLKRILLEEDNYIAPGSTMTLALPPEQSEHIAEFDDIKFRNITLRIEECNIYDRNVLEKFLVPEMRVLVMAEEEEGLDDEIAEQRDSKILMILLHLRYLSETKHLRLNVTCEMLRVEDQEVAQYANVNDFIVSKNLTSLIVTQICQQRELKQIFEELLREEGSEVYVRPAKNYIVPGSKTDIYTACEAAARQREVLIGYRLTDPETGEMEMITNPPKSREITFGEKDCLVVISLN
ncbi:MAG: hypothetical protein J6N15_02185 [Ruminiclostridium sp.]|nr:hypothetical protein [Ruminiclostridium sp.]